MSRDFGIASMPETTMAETPTTRVVAIHQPNFFPWLGYFDKLARSDVFVLLDHVQFPKTGGIWSNRVKLAVGGEARWITAPIVRSVHGVRRYDEVEFQPGQPWREKFVKSLSANYAKAPFYRASMEWIEPTILNPEPLLARYNRNAISQIADHIGLRTAHIQSSNELPVQGHATDLLVGLTRAVAADSYLCGGGAEGYQDDDAFASAGITLCYQSFQHPTYPQGRMETFLSGLSILDALMHCGAAGVRDLLQQARSS